MNRIIFIFCVGTLAALPQSPIVVDGTVSFVNPSASTLEITTSDRAIIDWDAFSLSANEHAEFLQPSATSSVLNRVTSATPSLLLGQLSSNGQVILINPHGILVGQSGRVNTGSFIASTLDLQNSVYLARGDLIFEGVRGSVNHEGTITVQGDVVLMGQSVSQVGTIQAKNGALIAGKEVVLASGVQGLYIRSTLAGDENNPFAKAFIPNVTQNLAPRLRQSPGIEIVEVGGSIEAIQPPTSTTQSRELSRQPGSQILSHVGYTHEEGEVCFRGEITAPGGEVLLLGDFVHLEEGMIDVSKSGGGGHIYVGGSYQGKDANLPASMQTFVGKDLVLKASALEKGDGGQVVVWSNGITNFWGSIEAVGENGGSAEVSGLKQLGYHGFTDLHPSTSNGIFGTLLLDPSDILIDNAASSPAFVPPIYDPAVVMATLDITDLNNGLAGASILVQTNAGVGGNGDITLASTALTGISWAADTKLTLRAERHLIINNTIEATTAYTGPGDQIELIADSGSTGTGDLIIYQTAGSIQVVTADGPISLSGANIDIGNPAITANVTVSAQGTRGSMTMNTPGLLRLQGPGVGFNGFALLSSALGQTINAGNWSIIGPGTGIGFPTIWLATGPVTAIVTGTTLVQGVGPGGLTESVTLDCQTLNLTTNDFSVIGGIDNNCNALIITAGAQDVLVNNRMVMRAGSANTTHARLTSGTTQTVQALNLEMYGGISGMLMAPNANAEIISNGTQIVTVTGTITMTPGDENTTDCLITANSGNQTVTCPNILMFGGTSTFGNCRSNITCSTGSQLITVDTLQMQGGTTPPQNGAGCRIAATVGPQRVNANVINMNAGDQINTDAEIFSQDNQTIDCATNINLTGISNTSRAWINSNGAQTISAININMNGETLIQAAGLQMIDVINDFTMLGDPLSMTQALVDANGSQQIANIGNNLTMMGNVSGAGASWQCGDNSILNVGAEWMQLGNGGNTGFNGGSDITIDVNGSYTLDSTTGTGSNFSCGDNLDMTIGTNLLIGSATSSATQGMSINNGSVGGCSIRVANNLLLTGGSGASASSAIDVRADYSIAAANDILIQGGTGADSIAGITQQFAPNPNVRLLVAHNDIILRGGSGDRSYAASINYSSHQIRAGRDLIVEGGVGLSAETFIFGVGANNAVPMIVGVQAGRDIFVSGGASLAGSSYGYMQVFTGDFLISAGRNIFLTGGSLAADNYALLGSAWVDLTPLAPPSNDTVRMTIQAPGNFVAQNGPTGSIAYIDQLAAGFVEPTFFRSVFPPLVLSNNGSLTIQCAGDITLCSGFNASEAPVPFNALIHDVTIVADAPLAAGALWTGTADPFLSGTPLISASPAVAANVLGGFKVETGSIGGGFAITSVAGNIHLSSAEFFANSTVDNLIIGSVATLNHLTLTSITGNITVDPFHNITITNPVTTGGNVFMIAQNDISMTSTGVITAGGSVELVCDNQAPTAPLVGPGAFFMDAGASITAGGPLRIFTARQSQNSILGLLNSLSFTAGPLFSDTNQERWCVYYPNPILGVPFTIFYKECLGSIISQQVGPIISQFLVDLHSYDEFLPGWLAEFSMTDPLQDVLSPEFYFLRRRQLRVVNHPKTILGL